MARSRLRIVHKSSWEPTRQRYLQWFKPTNSWRFRRAVPERLRSIIGQWEWTQTLAARTENEAIRLMQPHIADTDRTIASAERGNWPPIPDEDVNDVAFAWWTGEPGAKTMASAEIPRSVERFIIGPRSLGDILNKFPMLEWKRDRVVAILDDPKRNAAFRLNPDAMARLMHECRRYRAVHAVEKGHVEPFDVVNRPEGHEFPALVVAAPVVAHIGRVYPPISLGGTEAPDKSDLVSKWAKEANPDPRWLYQTRLSMKRFAALVELDHDDATRVTKPNVIRFKEKLDEKGLKPPTINRYLSEIKGPFEWAFKNEKIGTNPTEGVTFARN